MHSQYTTDTRCLESTKYQCNFENEFEKNAGLTDPEIIAFFDNY